MAPGFPSGVLIPEEDTVVRMPGSFSPGSNSNTNDTFNSGFYLDNIRIPSPLLYHRSGLGPGYTLNDEAPSDHPDFERTHGQPVPEPDFVTYRNVPQDDVPSGGEIPLSGIYSPRPTNAFLSFLGQDTKRPEHTASNSTCPDQTADRSQVRRGSDGCDMLDMPGSFRCYLGNNDIEHEENSGSPFASCRRTLKTDGDNLSFPKLSISAESQPCNTSHWNTTIVTPWRATPKRPLLRALEPKLAFTAPPSPCRDLVLASTFPTSLSLSPKRRRSFDTVPKLAPTTYPREFRKTTLALEWQPGSSMASHDEQQTQESREFVALSSEEVEKPGNPLDRVVPSPPLCRGALLLPSPLSATETEDEGYFSSGEILSDTELIDFIESDSDWEDWERESEFELNQGDKINTSTASTK